MRTLGRILTAMITPYDANGEVDLAEAGRIAQFLVARGNDGVVAAGSTGEGNMLDDDEKLALFGAVKAALGTTGTVIAGTTGISTRQSIALTKRAERTGIDAILATVPAYVKPTQEGMLAHFGAIAEATSLPVVIYNIPGRTAANMLPATFSELTRRHPNIAGIKESTGDVNQFTAILRERTREDVTFWCGDDYMFLPSLAVGGHGLISVAGHLASAELRALADAFDGGDADTAARIHQDLAPLVAGLFAVSNPIPVKWAMSTYGFTVGACRSPLSPMPDALTATLEPLIAPYRPAQRASSLREA
ncbi:4-hydroxy-tetrahydrodipicolinate synthase [Vulcanimicrobium alpinum]|uniref:4-hydroxy-tetrahydrodipicolinate synthase n=1 Tax=Vulcanimicrobium alpinum TaxID=3016050 RepID=A0AAN2C9F6_UNVUL|nr:4-hydroxy-tetrahydrodipicolinate synthase [Vulcanimicrobium alpinum]BDE05938.1 4-hydroxy-tetrahydrodipicolinate synthase [Vulcanimicrobium alpinum]